VEAMMIALLFVSLAVVWLTVMVLVMASCGAAADADTRDLRYPRA
jgi:uncharacterized membrane protein